MAAVDAGAADGGRFKTETSRRICNAFRHECLRKSPFFAERQTSFLEQVIQELEVELFQDGTTIIQQGEHGDKMYFLYCGQVDVLVGPEEVEVARLESGSVFGEMALFGQNKRAAAVRAVGFCDCRVINHRAFNGILRRNPEDRAFFTRMAEERSAQLQQINAEKAGPSAQGQLQGKKLGAGLRKMRMVAALKVSGQRGGASAGSSRAHSATPCCTRSTTPSAASSHAGGGAQAGAGGEAEAREAEAGAKEGDEQDDASEKAPKASSSRAGSISSQSSAGAAGQPLAAAVVVPSQGCGAAATAAAHRSTATAAPMTPLILRTAQKVSRFMSALPPELPPRIMPRAAAVGTAAGLAEAQGLFAEVTQPCFQVPDEQTAKFARRTARPRSHCGSTGHVGRITKVYRDLSKAPAKKIGRISPSSGEYHQAVKSALR